MNILFLIQLNVNNNIYIKPSMNIVLGEWLIQGLINKQQKINVYI